VNPFLFGLAIGSAGVLWKRIPYTHVTNNTRRLGGWQATRYCTIVTEGVNFRGRVRGRLYSLDVWREHGYNRA
jgi:hypothetical protein